VAPEFAISSRFPQTTFESPDDPSLEKYGYFIEIQTNFTSYDSVL
jgi:hypothetical protein